MILDLFPKWKFLSAGSKLHNLIKHKNQCIKVFKKYKKWGAKDGQIKLLERQLLTFDWKNWVNYKLLIQNLQKMDK